MTFKEFAEALLSGKEIVLDEFTFRITPRGALERTYKDPDDETEEQDYFDQGDFDMEGSDLKHCRIKEKSIVVYESELNKLVDKLTKVKTTQSGDVKDSIAKTLQSMLKMN